MPLVLVRQAINKSPCFNIDNQFLQIVQMGGDSNHKTMECDHGLWPEANVGQKCGEGRR